MKKISLVTIKDFFAKFVKNLTWMFFAAFLILLVLEVFTVKKSIDIAMNLNKQPEVAPKSEKGVRINFSEYQKATSRIKASDDFRPSEQNSYDPFAAPLPLFSE